MFVLVANPHERRWPFPRRCELGDGSLGHRLGHASLLGEHHSPRHPHCSLTVLKHEPACVSRAHEIAPFRHRVDPRASEVLLDPACVIAVPIFALVRSFTFPAT